MKTKILSAILFSVCYSVNIFAQVLWTQKTNFGGAGRMLAAGFSIGSKGYIGTGSNGTTGYYNDFWEYDPITDSWSQKANLPGIARAGAVGFSIGSKGYLDTGGYSSGTLGDFYEYNPSINTWTQKANFGGNSRQWAVGFTIGSKGYVGMGESGSPKKDFWEYDPTTDSWTQKADFGGGTWRWAAAFAIGNIGYVGTGNIAPSQQKKEFWKYDPVSNTWKKLYDFPGLQRHGAAGFAIGNKGYIGSGWYYPSGGAYLQDLWEYAPCNSFLLNSGTVVPSGCNSSDGIVAVIASGGALPYSYLWNPVTATNSTVTGIPLGNYSVNVSDANGCSSSLTITVEDSCDYIWPGDANDDGIANNLDILAIGMGFGKTGAVRAGASLNWIGQPCNNWVDTLPNGSNYKHSDCNGDGTIGYTDTNAVILNYGMLHNNKLGNISVLSNTDMYTQISVDTINSGGALVTVQIGLGTSASPAANVYGTAFSINFSNPALIDPASVSFKGQNS